MKISKWLISCVLLAVSELTNIPSVDLWRASSRDIFAVSVIDSNDILRMWHLEQSSFIKHEQKTVHEFN